MTTTKVGGQKRRLAATDAAKPKVTLRMTEYGADSVRAYQKAAQDFQKAFDAFHADQGNQDKAAASEAAFVTLKELEGSALYAITRGIWR